MLNAKTRKGVSFMKLQEIKIASDQTHHLYQGRPFYSRKFAWVLKYHPPGLAPVGDESGAYHITLEGVSAYEYRYLRTFGYYYEISFFHSPSGLRVRLI